MYAFYFLCKDCVVQFNKPWYTRDKYVSVNSYISVKLKLWQVIVVSFPPPKRIFGNVSIIYCVLQYHISTCMASTRNLVDSIFQTLRHVNLEWILYFLNADHPSKVYLLLQAGMPCIVMNMVYYQDATNISLSNQWFSWTFLFLPFEDLDSYKFNFQQSLLTYREQCPTVSKTSLEMRSRK